MVDEVLAAVRTVRAPVVLEESALHAIIAGALYTAGITFTREARIGPRCRVDFLCGASVALEVKRGHPSPKALRAQLERYAACEGVSAIVLVSETAARLPKAIGGKPVHALSLRSLWGVST